MGVYIKDMEMPGCCAECDFCMGLSVASGDYIYYCVEDVYVPNEIVMEGRPDWCPLVEIPTPHGKLIDADKFKSDNPLHIELDVPHVTEVSVEDKIDDAPIVIEAEE